MYVAPQWQARIKPLIVSHGTGAGFCSDFVWTGCQDYGSLLTLLSTARLWRRLVGLERAMKHNHALALRAARHLAKRWGTELLVGNGDPSGESDAETSPLSANILCVRLPGPLLALHEDEHNEVPSRLRFEHKIEAPIKLFPTVNADGIAVQPAGNLIWIRIQRHDLQRF